jgi:hypothetical protein
MQLTKREPKLGGSNRGSAVFIESRFAADPRCSPDMDPPGSHTIAKPGSPTTPARAALGATAAWLLGILVAVGLGVAVMALGLSLSTYDEQRHHIPGHLLYNALIMLPGLAQLCYLVPLYRGVQRRQHQAFAWGLCVEGSLVIVANGALLWLNHLFSRMD